MNEAVHVLSGKWIEDEVMRTARLEINVVSGEAAIQTLEADTRDNPRKPEEKLRWRGTVELLLESFNDNPPPEFEDSDEYRTFYLSPQESRETSERVAFVIPRAWIDEVRRLTLTLRAANPSR